MGQLVVVVGGGAGSEGKGAVTARLARDARHPVACVRVAGPNAGHTAYDADGRKWALRQIPVAAVTNPDALLIIAAGSEIDPEVLEAEISALENAGHKIRDRLEIDAQATVVEPEHRNRETAVGLTNRIGSTGKGIGAARADRVMRTARVAQQVLNGRTDDTAATLRDWLTGGDVIIEGTQGWALGLHAGYYPYATSSDCRAIDFLAMAGLSPWAKQVSRLRVVVCLRVYPIRVAGNSGPMCAETSWEQLGLPEERTTVTKKVRRVGHWDPAWARAAVDANGGPERVEVALTMADQKIPGIAGLDGPFEAVTRQMDRETLTKLVALLRQTADDCGWAPIRLVGTGPATAIEL